MSTKGPKDPQEGKGAPVSASESASELQALKEALRAAKAQLRTGGTPRRKPFNWPPNPDGVKAHRLGTKRAYVIETLTGPGATFEEIADSAICQWDRRTCYEGIALLNKLLGYGLTEDTETGIIRAFTSEAG